MLLGKVLITGSLMEVVFDEYDEEVDFVSSTSQESSSPTESIPNYPVVVPSLLRYLDLLSHCEFARISEGTQTCKPGKNTGDSFVWIL